MVAINNQYPAEPMPTPEQAAKVRAARIMYFLQNSLNTLPAEEQQRLQPLLTNLVSKMAQERSLVAPDQQAELALRKARDQLHHHKVQGIFSGNKGGNNTPNSTPTPNT